MSVLDAPEVSREMFEKAVLKASRKKNLKPSQVQALKLYAQLHFGLDTGGSKPPSDNEPQKFAIGSIIVQDGVRYEVVAREIKS
jgi:hypothetical protein